MPIPYKVKINKDGSYEYYDLNNNPVTPDGKPGAAKSKTLPEVVVTAETPDKKQGLGLLDPQVYLKDLPRAYETLHNNYTAKGLSLPAEYTSFREVNDELAKIIGDAALTYVGGKALKPLGAVVKSTFPVISKFTNPKILKHTLSKVPQRFTNAVKNFNLKDSANDFIFNNVLSKPISKLQFAGDVAAGMAMNHYANKPILNGQSIVDMLSSASHFNPTMTNGILDMASGAAWENQVSQRFRGTLKRAVETTMRTSGDNNPLNHIYPKLWRNQPDKRYRNNTIKYILTGKGYKPLLGFNPIKGPLTKVDDLKSLIYKDPEYTGIYNFSEIRYDGGYGDVIDASLYGIPIDPKIVKQVNTDDLGIHTTYVYDNYSDKIDDIKIYTGTPETFDTKLPPASVSTGINSSMLSLQSDIGIDTGGHIVTKYYDPGKPLVAFSRPEYPDPDTFIVEQDIWKFNPKDYAKRWGIRDLTAKMGLNVVDDLTTPIIFRNVYRDYHPNIDVFFGLDK